MLAFRLPGEADREEVMAFYQEFEESGGTCIGFGGWRDYDRWLQGMKNRHAGKDLPEGYVREDFNLCWDEDNTASEKVILRNGGVLEDTRFDPEERVTVKRYWIGL